jgi:hypothetical protein
MPSFDWRNTAVPGKWISGDSVATMMQSMSLGVQPASSMARFAAGSATSLHDHVPSFGTYRRSSMPVRVLIHASLVSMRGSAARTC